MNLIRHHGFAVPRTSEHDAALALAARDRFCSWAYEERIVHRVFTECAEVFYFMTERTEQFFYLFFVTETGVIRAERNLHSTIYYNCRFLVQEAAGENQGAAAS
jgi:hypothetical protein